MPFCISTLSAFSLLLSLSVAHAGSEWNSIFVEATEAYSVDYKTDRNMTAPEPVGFSLALDTPELIPTVYVYYSEGNNLLSYSYACHSHGDHAHCLQKGKGVHGTHTRLGNRYGVAEVAKSIDAALDIFVRKVAPETAIRSMKIWESDDINFIITYEKNGLKKEFLMCHYHGGTTMDCHRKGNPGPGEPDKK